MKSRTVKTKRPRRSRSPLSLVNPDAAGIDCGLSEHYVAVPRDRGPEPVRRFRTFTEDLHGLADWLVSCRIRTVAMEATGVFWIPVYEILEARGLQVLLVNARHVKNVPGRKSDVSDCEWLQQLHAVGLLRGSFRPAADIAALRSYLRHRESLVQTASTAVQRMQKAMIQMNLQLQVVITDIRGTTGLRIIRDIVAGQTHPQQLAKHRSPRCSASEKEIAAALTGNYRPEHVFVLQQNLEIFDALQRQIEACDKRVEDHLQQLTASSPHASTPVPPARPRGHSRGEPNFDLRTPLHLLTGADLSQIDGIGPFSAVRLLSEIGTDMSRWPSEQHFTSWLTLAPNNKISGGRLLSSSTQPSANRAAGILQSRP
jgi:transposase